MLLQLLLALCVLRDIFKISQIRQHVYPASQVNFPIQMEITCCTSCSSGRYSPFTNSTSSQACPAGRYQNAAGASECQIFSPGKFSSDHASICSSCPFRYFPRYRSIVKLFTLSTRKIYGIKWFLELHIVHSRQVWKDFRLVFLH